MGQDVGARYDAEREKRAAAANSVVAAVFLTSIKIVVGLMTGSLGILSEAAHSALDLVAAGVTWLAVRLSGRPADPEHTYGHGKIENLSALFETVLLLATCVWIIYEAIQRLFFRQDVHVEASVWAFVVMGISIVVDVSRSRMLRRVAQKYDSQALEADALHFSTDIWSSTVVIGGLVLVAVANWMGWPWLVNADAVAALGVAGIVVYISSRLGMRTIAGLLDSVPSDLAEQIRQAVRLPGVIEVKQVRVRRSGPEAFADITLIVGRDVSFEQAHGIATVAEKAVQAILPGADVVVHVDPGQARDEDAFATIRVVAGRFGLGVHSLHVYDVMGSRSVEMHLEVDEGLTVDEAHGMATEFETALARALPRVTRVTTHIEPSHNQTARGAATATDAQTLQQVLDSIPAQVGFEFHPHDLEVHNIAGQLNVSFHCRFDGEAMIADAHERIELVEGALRRAMGNLGAVTIHIEPAAGRRH